MECLFYFIMPSSERKVSLQSNDERIMQTIPKHYTKAPSGRELLPKATEGECESKNSFRHGQAVPPPSKMEAQVDEKFLPKMI